MTATLPHVPVRIACPHCAAVAEVRRGPHGLVIACRECRERDEMPFANTCRVCRTRTDGRFAHEDCLRRKGWER